MIGKILTEKWLRSVYPNATIEPAQYTCARLSGVKNKEWERLDSILRGSTFFIGYANPNDIDTLQFKYKGSMVSTNGSANNDFIQLLKFDEVVAIGTGSDYFQVFGYLVTMK